MLSTKENNKRIAKNTILLYFRMIISTIVSLYTARLTLKLLGIEDYGIYNVVGSIMGFMSVITATMISATQRFFAYSLGKGDIIDYRKTFSMMINVFMIYSLISILLMEIIGPYAINHFLVIPDNRLIAAQWIFQFSIITFVISTLIIPFQSSIIAYEKMGIFAYFTIIDVVFKLLIVFCLYIISLDRLITYGLLGVIIHLIINVIILIYCKRNLEGCKYEYIWDKTLFKKLSSYAGWNLFGSLSWMMNNQGQAILLNFYYGPIVNAAKAIGDKINSIITSFVYNFYMAVNPQIIKKYAEGNIDYMRELVFRSSKFGFMLLAVLSFPLISNMNSVLILWLGEEQVSSETVIFSQLVLVYSMINVLESPLTQTIRATGNIKRYQVFVGIQTLCFIPLCLIVLSLGTPAYYTMIVLCIIYAIAHITRLHFVKPIIQMTYETYFKNVLQPILNVTIMGILMVYFTYTNFTCTTIFFLLKIIIEFIVFITIVFFIGFNNKERKKIIEILLRINRHKQSDKTAM